jgi:hypothetical protein
VSVSTIDEAKAELYGVPNESFVAERDAMVKALRQQKDRDLANEVKALRKPSAVAAEVNRIVRADVDGVELILQAAELLRAAQSGALGDADVAGLQQQYRAAIQAMAQNADGYRVEVRAALEAATIDVDSNDALRAGTLVVVPTPVSIFGVAPPTEAPPSAPTDELAARRAKKSSAAKGADAKDSKAEKKAAKTDEQAAKDAEAKARKAEEAAAQKAAAEEAAAQKAAAEEAAAKKAAEEAAAAAAKEAKAAKVAQRKALKAQLKDRTKEHREALRAQLSALDAQADAATAIEDIEQAIEDLRDQIATAETDLVSAKEAQVQAAAMSTEAEDVVADLAQSIDEIEAALEELAD